ncbi:ASCH domain-containing protein [Streptomyces sp. NPDC048172]|uniref:ASCH domain-containing protein n=1 Tax=Streptomyces sp. NPDC048172 TaxID=3365505 RepID=UPI003722D1B9
MLSERDWTLVRHAAEVAAGLGEDDDHTVVAAAYDADGTLVTGVNAHHFSGGPCAEQVLIGRAAERRMPVRLDTVVACLKEPAAVLPPCGRCRQMLFDYHPETRVVVRGRNGLESVAVRDLLPYAYDWRAYEPSGGGPELFFDERHLAAVRAGTRRVTVRVHDPALPGPVRLVFPHRDGTATTLPAEITGVRTARVDALSDEDARRDGFPDRAALREALARRHPGLDPAAEAEVVDFRLA